MKKQNPEFRIRKPEGKNRTAPFHLLNSESWLLASIFLTFSAFTASAAAQTETDIWRLCSDLRLVRDPAAKAGGNPDSGRIFADADSIESPNKDVSRLNGNVSILHGTEELFADQALYDRAEQRFELTGNVRFRSPEMELAGARMRSYGVAMEISDAKFYFPGHHAAGSADQIERAGPLINLKDTHYSTCDPSDPDWEFRARRITLDQDKGEGYARNLSIYFQGLPIFYFPALSFPIDDRRKSGFLLPGIGESDKHGFELETPYYWNIAPQADATLTPHLMTERGVKLDSEWRYLNRWSMNELQLEYLDDDKSGDKRELASLKHNGSLGGGWTSHINYNEVSDTDYLDDFGSNLSGSSITHLEQSIQIGKSWQNWSFSSQLLEFQTIDETISPAGTPYRLNPALNFGGTRSYGDHLEFTLSSSATDFEHELRTSGTRIDIRPRLAFPFGGSGWHLTPALSARHTAYRLENPMLPAITTEIDRNVPTFSLDSGLVFERTVGTDGGWLQTLEPRVFLLKTPFREQADIPIFDTGLPDLSFAQLFSENRFIGTDRVGDAEQASVALSSSILRRDNGEEILRVGFGRIYYKEDLRVTLPGLPVESPDESGLLAEIRAGLSRHWSASLTVERNSEREDTDKELFRLRYQRDNRHVFNLAYRSRAAEDLEQSDISFSWPISDRWSAVGRWNRSLNDDIDLERFAGFQYESCCYAVRIIAREYLTETQLQNTSVFLQLSLKGLTQIGDNADELLERGIPGYRNPY